MGAVHSIEERRRLVRRVVVDDDELDRNGHVLAKRLQASKRQLGPVVEHEQHRDRRPVVGSKAQLAAGSMNSVNAARQDSTRACAAAAIHAVVAPEVVTRAEPAPLAIWARR